MSESTPPPLPTATPPPLPRVEQSVPLWQESLDAHEPLVDQPQGFGGWLALFTGGLLLSVPTLALRAIHLWTTYTRPGVWPLFTSPDSPRYHPLWSIVMICEMAGSFLRVVFCVTLVVLLFRRQRALPVWASGVLLGTTLYLWLDFFLSSQIPAVARRGLEQSFISCTATTVVSILWCAYFATSKRVKATFVR